MRTDEQDVLYLEKPFTTLPGINQKKTKQNIIHFLQSRVSAGEKIHYKASPSSPVDFLSGSNLQNNEHVLESEIPAEVFMPSYRMIYFYLSSTVRAPGKGIKVRLFGLVEFNNPSIAQHFNGVEQLGWAKEHDKILTVRPMLKFLPRRIWPYLPEGLLIKSASTNLD